MFVVAVFCVVVSCPPGFYTHGEECKLCKEGTYQDESDKNECKRCPLLKSTRFVGAISVFDCSCKIRDVHFLMYCYR